MKQKSKSSLQLNIRKGNLKLKKENVHLLIPPKKFYHFSLDDLPIGTILEGRKYLHQRCDRQGQHIIDQFFDKHRPFPKDYSLFTNLWLTEEFDPKIAMKKFIENPEIEYGFLYTIELPENTKPIPVGAKAEIEACQAITWKQLDYKQRQDLLSSLAKKFWNNDLESRGDIQDWLSPKGGKIIAKKKIKKMINGKFNLETILKENIFSKKTFTKEEEVAINNFRSQYKISDIENFIENWEMRNDVEIDELIEEGERKYDDIIDEAKLNYKRYLLFFSQFSDQFMIYRGLLLNPGVPPAYKRIGEYWTWDKKIAISWWWKQEATILSAFIQKNDIDWNKTLLQNTDLGYTNEREINVKKGRNLLVTKNEIWKHSEKGDELLFSQTVNEKAIAN